MPCHRTPRARPVRAESAATRDDNDRTTITDPTERLFVDAIAGRTEHFPGRADYSPGAGVTRLLVAETVVFVRTKCGDIALSVANARRRGQPSRPCTTIIRVRIYMCVRAYGRTTKKIDTPPTDVRRRRSSLWCAHTHGGVPRVVAAR